jgi:hypothetical protein
LQKVHFCSTPPQTPILLMEEGLQKVIAKIIDGTHLDRIRLGCFQPHPFSFVLPPHAEPLNAILYQLP